MQKINAFFLLDCLGNSTATITNTGSGSGDKRKQGDYITVIGKCAEGTELN